MAEVTERSASMALILGAMAAGALLGWLARAGGPLDGLQLVAFGGFLGAAFLNLLKMLVVPLVIASIIAGVAGMGGLRDLGRLGGLAFSYYLVTTLLAVVLALLFVNGIAPGIIDGEPAGRLLALHTDSGAVAASVQGQAGRSLGDVLLGLIPANLFEAAAGTRLVGLIFFGLLFGYCITQLEPPLRDTLANFWQATFQVMMRMTGYVMRLTPLGVFGLTLKVAAEAGLDAARPLLLFALCVVASLAVYAVVVLPLLMRLAGIRRPWAIFPALAPALLTAFSTASSSATMPLTLDCLQRRAGVSARVSGFVLPLGTSVNHAGSALYECAAALFIAQAYGLHLSLPTQLVVVLLALLTSMGIAGIPAASLVGITVILAAVGLPVEAVGVLLVLDRLLDMLRTGVNVLADAVGTTIVARLTGEKAVLAPGEDGA
ncbi:MAG: dicarboxylate/amino acid:cation symporter [Steroidobacteraceae bacterium]